MKEDDSLILNEIDDEEVSSGLDKMKGNYVLQVNGSRFHKKPYFKNLSTNVFEADFFFLLDERKSVPDRLSRLYKLF